MLLNNRMLFLIVHYWEVMVDVWPAIVKVTVVTVSQQINQRSRLSKSPFFFFSWLVMPFNRLARNSPVENSTGDVITTDQ